MIVYTKVQRDELRKVAKLAMVSYVGEYCPPEFFELLDQIDALETQLTLAIETLSNRDDDARDRDLIN